MFFSLKENVSRNKMKVGQRSLTKNNNYFQRDHSADSVALPVGTKVGLTSATTIPAHNLDNIISP